MSDVDTVTQLSLAHAGRRFAVATAGGVSLAIPLELHGGPQPTHFGAPAARAEPLVAAGFIGDARQGGSCNCEAVTLVPHCNGTHTEGPGHLTDERPVQQHMAIFTNKADEIATRLDNWAIRERVFTMEHTRWERAVGCTGFEIPCVIDEEEVRTITGTMSRFPSFRDTGWHILRTARVVGEA